MHRIVEDERGYKHAFGDFNVTVMNEDTTETRLFNRVQMKPFAVGEDGTRGIRNEALGAFVDGVYVYFYDGKFVYSESRMTLGFLVKFLELGGFSMDDTEHAERRGVHVYLTHPASRRRKQSVFITKREIPMSERVE